VIVVLQVKLVVPQSTAAMIVGKGGEYLAQIQKESSARVHMGQKNDENTLPERIVTVQGKCAVCQLLHIVIDSLFHSYSAES